MLSKRETASPFGLAQSRYWYNPLMEGQHENAVTRVADIIQREQIASGDLGAENSQRN